MDETSYKLKVKDNRTTRKEPVVKFALELHFKFKLLPVISIFQPHN